MSGKHTLSLLLRGVSRRPFSNPVNLRSRTPVAFPLEERLLKPVDVNLISRRFLHQQKPGSSPVSAKGRDWKSKYLGAIGTLLGVGSGLAFFGFIQNRLSTAQCAKSSSGDAPGPDGCIPKKCEDSPCLRKHDCEEELTRKANDELVKALKDVKGKSLEYTEAAMKAYCDAIAIMKEYMDQGYARIDNDLLESPDYEKEWCRIYETAKKRYIKVKDAIEKGQCAWELLCRLKLVIDEGKSCKYTACHPLLVTAEEFLICAQRELLNLKTRMDCVGSEHVMVEQYKEVVKCFKNLLKAELDATPATEKCCVKYVEQENALIFDMAYIRAVRLQKALAHQQVTSGEVPENGQCVEC